MQWSIHHIAIFTENPHKLASFYEKLLEIERVHERKEETGILESVWLRTGETVLMFELANSVDSRINDSENGNIQKNQKFEAKIPNNQLISFRAENSDLDRLKNHLLRQQIPIEKKTEFTLYFFDPDGNRVGLTVFSHADYLKIIGS